MRQALLLLPLTARNRREVPGRNAAKFRPGAPTQQGYKVCSSACRPPSNKRGCQLAGEGPIRLAKRRSRYAVKTGLLYAHVAQQEEQRIFNPWAGSSILSMRTSGWPAPETIYGAVHLQIGTALPARQADREATDREGDKKRKYTLHIFQQRCKFEPQNIKIRK